MALRPKPVIQTRHFVNFVRGEVKRPLGQGARTNALQWAEDKARSQSRYNKRAIERTRVRSWRHEKVRPEIEKRVHEALFDGISLGTGSIEGDVKLLTELSKMRAPAYTVVKAYCEATETTSANPREKLKTKLRRILENFKVMQEQGLELQNLRDKAGRDERIYHEIAADSLGNIATVVGSRASMLLRKLENIKLH